MMEQRICILDTSGDLSYLAESAKKFNIPIVYANDVEDVSDQLSTTYFVIKDFQGPIFESLNRKRAKILGPTALIQLSEKYGTLPSALLRRPLCCLALQDVTVCFTGYREKDELHRISHQVLYMGGKVRPDMEVHTTHLVAHRPGGAKFKYAETFGIPVMADSWVSSAWEHRSEKNYSATAPAFVGQHKLKFRGQRVCFLGFSDEETKDMSDVLASNNGELSHTDDPLCTHLVVDEISSPPIPESLPPTCHVVKASWFWASVQNEICAEADEYTLICSGQQTPDSRVGATPGSAASRARKRKRLQQLAARQSDSPANTKRRSSVCALDLDWTLTPEKELDDCKIPDAKPVSVRQQKYLELVHTETNYVDILNVIVKSFKAPLESMVDSGNPILDSMELKMIFGNLPPILDAHTAMLIELKAGQQNWSSDFSIGEIILSKASELQRAYPPFINYFEKSKEALERCESSNPRFYAFLKLRQSQPECGRQTLKELLIRPVQRLPSVSLLLNDLLKNTDKTHRDFSSLAAALAAVKEVMTHINEDKRRTDAQLAMLELCNEIENCPPDLISSHRTLIIKADCTELVEGRKGDPVTLMLFTDTVELCCKRRGKHFPTLRGTKPRSNQKASKTKQYKHLRLLPLTSVRRVVDVRDQDDAEQVFALVVDDALVAFSINDDAFEKQNFLATLRQQVARAHCTVDPDDFEDEMDLCELGFKASSHSLNKALKFGNTVKAKVGRALSLNRTPSRGSRIIRRGVEAPSPATSQLAHLRLHSCATLNELGRYGFSRRASLPPASFFFPPK